MNNFGQNLKEYREQSCMTQEQVSKSIKVTRQAISNWERGHSYPDIFALRDLAKLFNVTMEKLMTDDIQLGKVISQHISEQEGMFYMAVSCPNCLRRHELSETINEHKHTKLYRFACDCNGDKEFIFDIRPQKY